MRADAARHIDCLTVCIVSALTPQSFGAPALHFDAQYLPYYITN
jgi:hypothetical protein